MYDFVVSIVGTVPTEFNFIYVIGVVVMLCTFFGIIMSIFGLINLGGRYND